MWSAATGELPEGSAPSADVAGATAFDPLEPPIAVAFLAAAVALLAGVQGTGRH